MEPVPLDDEQKQPLSEDQMLLGSILRRYEDRLAPTHERILERLKANSLDVVELRDLTYRHTLLFFAALEALGSKPKYSEQVACGAVLAYSIPLVALDTKVDGHPSALRKSESIWAEVIRPGTAELLIHKGYCDIAEGAGSIDAVRFTSQVASNVVAAMRLDAHRRGKFPEAEVGDRFIDDYWNSPSSRLRGSGIGRLMIGLASIMADGTLPDDRDWVAIILGILRQLADELMDVVEDVRGGLVTLPVAYGLRCPKVSNELTRLIQRLWNEDDRSTAKKLQLIEDRQLRDLVLTGEGHVQVILMADKLLAQAREISSESFTKPELIDALLIHRRLQIDSAVANRLREPAQSPNVDELLALSPGY
jgi:hypothetical protein